MRSATPRNVAPNASLRLRYLPAGVGLPRDVSDRLDNGGLDDPAPLSQDHLCCLSDAGLLDREEVAVAALFIDRLRPLSGR